MLKTNKLKFWSYEHPKVDQINPPNLVNSAMRKSSKCRLYPPQASGVCLHWELGDVIFRRNRPFAFSTFPFFTPCNLAFTISFTWDSSFHPLTSLFSKALKEIDRGQAQGVRSCFAYRGSILARAYNMLTLVHTHSHTQFWLILNWSWALVAVRAQLSLLSPLISDICRYYIHGARRLYFVMWSRVTL